MLETAKLILTFIPLLIEILKAIEATNPKPGLGEAKQEAAISILNELVPAAKDVGDSVKRLIGILVRFFNATGLFEKS